MATFQTISAAAIGGGGSLGYSVYVALLSQTGTNAPVATVLDNTLSGNITWGYGGVGNYTATLTGEFTAGKTCAFIGAFAGVAFIAYPNINTVQFDIYDDAGTPQNDYLSTTPVEIRVYP